MVAGRNTPVAGSLHGRTKKDSAIEQDLYPLRTTCQGSGCPDVPTGRVVGPEGHLPGPPRFPVADEALLRYETGVLWSSAIAFRLLVDLAEDQRAVLHHPETPRYGRARAQLPYLLRASTALGVRSGEAGSAVSVELAAWVPHPAGRGHGFYSCFRLVLEDHVVVYAILFCFYDGTERSPGFRTPEAARAFPRSQGFQEVLDEAQDTH